MLQYYQEMKHSVKDALSHFKTADPVLYQVAISLELQDLAPHDNYFLELYDSIVSQQLSVKAAGTIMGRLKKLYPNEEITPEHTLKLDAQTMRDAGNSFAKIKYLKDLSIRVVDGRLKLDRFKDLPEEEIMKELLLVNGIGPWTAEMFIMFSLGRPDVFSYGDQGLKNAMRTIYKLEDRPTLEEALAISGKWSPYRTYACKILWKSLDNMPSVS